MSVNLVFTCSRRVQPWLRALLTVCLAAFFAGCKSARADKLPPDPLGNIGIVTHDGKTLNTADFRDKTLIVSFFFTSCPVVCPRQTRALTEVWHALPPDVRDRVEFLSVSVDPENDTPEALQRFARTHAPGLRGFTFARADQAGTRALTSRLAAFDTTRPEGALPGGHTTAFYLFDARGRLLQRYGGATDSARLAREIQQIDVMSRSRN